MQSGVERACELGRAVSELSYAAGDAAARVEERREAKEGAAQPLRVKSLSEMENAGPQPCECNQVFTGNLERAADRKGVFLVGNV